MKSSRLKEAIQTEWTETMNNIKKKFKYFHKMTMHERTENRINLFTLTVCSWRNLFLGTHSVCLFCHWMHYPTIIECSRIITKFLKKIADQRLWFKAKHNSVIAPKWNLRSHIQIFVFSHAKSQLSFTLIGNQN